MHTSFSGDSEAPMESMIEASIKAGLKDICITDHMDYNIPHEVEECYMYDPVAQFACMKSLREKYAGIINVHYGVEIGFCDEGADFYKKLLDSYPFDFNIGSVHIVDAHDPYYPKYWTLFDTERAGIERYFDRVIYMIKKYKNYDALGHLDYVFRYAPVNHSYDYKEYSDYIDTILKILIGDGKALEVNTAGYKYGLGVPNPQPQVLKRYKELGGELISVGADGHKPEHVAYDYAKCEALLKECGFDHIAIYKEHKPVMYRI